MKKILESFSLHKFKNRIHCIKKNFILVFFISSLKTKAVKSLTSITYNTASSSSVGVAGTTSIPMLRLDFLVGGTGGTLNLNSIEVNSLNTTDGDVSNVKLYYTSSTTFSTASQLGTTQTFSSGAVSFTSLSYDLPSGTTYVWVTYDISSTGTIGNTLDAKIVTNKINVAGSTYPASDQSPSGSRTLNGSPGGIYSNLAFWLDPCRGITLSGSNVTSWADRSGYTNDFTGGATKPTFVANGMNYTEITRWASGTSTMTATSNSLSNWTFYMVLKTATGLTIEDASYVIKYEQWPSSGKYGYTRKSIADYTSAISSNFNKPDLLRFDHTTSNSNINVYTQAAGVLGSSSFACGTTTLNGPVYNLTCDNGDFCEFLGYNTRITSSTTQTQIESYLSLKYGITLQRSRASSAYLNSAGTTTYTDAGTYWNDIIGIARDDYSVLLKKQSHNTDDSIRIYIGSLAASNSANTSVAADFGGDRASVILGSNNGYMVATNSTASEKPAGISYRLNRELKVTNTNFSGSYSLQFTLSSNASPASVTASHLRLLVDDDGDFSNATIYANGSSGITISYSNPIVTVSGISTSVHGSNTTKYMTIASASSSTTLPVELSNFEGNCQGYKPKLNWTTQTESQNNYFIIEWSKNGMEFDSLDYVDGSGNSNTQINYTWVDANANEEIVIYRLKQVDFDGNYQYSKNLAIDICFDSNKINVYPNPFLNHLTIDINGFNKSEYDIELVDLYGRKCFHTNNLIEENQNTKVTIPIKDGPTGIYFLKLILNGKEIKYKLLKTE